MRTNTIWKKIGMGMAFTALAAGAILGLTWVVMTLWNTILPDLVHVGTLSFWHAMGLLVLCKILFGGMRMGGGNHGRNKWKEKMHSMSKEEKEEFKRRMKERWMNRSC